MAGTSTSVGTSIGGTAARSDGRPAAGVLVVARSDEIAWIGGKPEGRLEIICDSARVCSDRNEVWHDWAAAESGRLPAARLAVPGSLEGDWKPIDGEAPPWIGIARTARFMRPDPAGSRFRLEGLSPGNHFLTILRKQGEDPGNAQKVGSWRVASGKATEVGTLK